MVNFFKALFSFKQEVRKTLQLILNNQYIMNKSQSDIIDRVSKKHYAFLSDVEVNEYAPAITYLHETRQFAGKFVAIRGKNKTITDIGDCVGYGTLVNKFCSNQEPIDTNTRVFITLKKERPSGGGSFEDVIEMKAGMSIVCLYKPNI